MKEEIQTAIESFCIFNKCEFESVESFVLYLRHKNIEEFKIKLIEEFRSKDNYDPHDLKRALIIIKSMKF